MKDQIHLHLTHSRTPRDLQVVCSTRHSETPFVRGTNSASHGWIPPTPQRRSPLASPAAIPPTPDDVNNNKLHPLSYPSRSRSPFIQQSETTPSYATRYDPHRSQPDHRPNGSDNLEASLLKGGGAVPKTYKRRYLGLAERILLSFATGWGYAAPGVVATAATEWSDIEYTTLNSLSIASSLVFLVPAPFVIWVLNRQRPKRSIMIACVLTVLTMLGTWIVYGATRAKNFPGNVIGTIISSLAALFIIPHRRETRDFGSRTVVVRLPPLRNR